MGVNQDKLNEIVGKFVTELGASMQGPAIIIGEQLGLYKTLSAHGPLTPDELAKKTGTSERYVREWLAGQAAGGYVNYEASRPVREWAQNEVVVGLSPFLIFELVCVEASDLELVCSEFIFG